MTADKELLELAANSEALELMVKYELGIYRGYDSCRGEFTEVFYRPRTYALGKSYIEYHKDHPSPIEATRRAIGRAARLGAATERAARQKAQAEVAELKERIARAGVEHRRALHEALQQEREACAKVCDEVGDKMGGSVGAYECAAAIRGRTT